MITDQRESQPRKTGGIRTVLRFTWIGVLIAAAYVAWIFYSRHERAAAAEAELKQKKQQEAERVNNLIFGSGELQFSTFVADRGVLQRGESTELCYGVVNAVSVELTPPIEQAKPSYRHCIEISPKVTTTYTITAKDAKGNSKTASLTVVVK
jgi:hypothetical protein